MCFSDVPPSDLRKEADRIKENVFQERDPINKLCLKSPCTASTALLALIEVHGLLIQILQ